jgi:hypothetical protein
MKRVQGADVEDALARRSAKCRANDLAPTHGVPDLVQGLELFARLLVERQLAHRVRRGYLNVGLAARPEIMGPAGLEPATYRL